MSEHLESSNLSIHPQAKPAYSMHGLAYVPMPLGAIRIGHAITLPSGGVELVRDDEFKITQPLRQDDGSWLVDPLDGKLRQADTSTTESTAQRKLREIPIRIHVNDPSLVVQSKLEAFDVTTRRTVCASNGSGRAKRWSGATGTVEVACEGCDRCSFALSGAVECKFFGRIAVQIDGQEGELGTYVMRTTSYNTLKTFEAKLWQFWSVLGGKLRGIPFVMKLRAAQTELSNWTTFYFVDLELNKATLVEAARAGQKQAKDDIDCGFNIAGLQLTMIEGLRNGGYLPNAAEDGVDLNEFISAAKFTATLQASHRGSGAGAAGDVTVKVGAAAGTSLRVDELPQGTLATAADDRPSVPAPGAADCVTNIGASNDAGGIYVQGFGATARRPIKKAEQVLGRAILANAGVTAMKVVVNPNAKKTTSFNVDAVDPAMGKGAKLCMHDLMT